MLSEDILLSFRDGLRDARSEKTAAIPWHSIAGGAAAGAGMGSAIGAGVGALHGGYKNYRDAREQGAGVGGSLVHGLVGAGGGAYRGAGYGAMGGALLGAGAGKFSPGTVSKMTQGETPVLSAAARFGQRQMHGLTGWTPTKGDPNSLLSIRGGHYDAAEALKNAKPGNVEKATAGLAAAEEATKRGLTSLPGYVKAVRRDGLGSTLKADLANQWHGAGWETKALMVGAPAYGVYDAARHGSKDPNMTNSENMGDRIGGVVGGVVGSPMPLFAQQAVQSGASRIGRAGGRAVGYLRGERRPAPQAPTLPETTQQ